MQIRAADPVDTAAVVELNAVVQQMHYEARPDWFVAPDTEAIRSWLTASLDRDALFIFVAEDDGGVVDELLTWVRSLARISRC